MLSYEDIVNQRMAIAFDKQAYFAVYLEKNFPNGYGFKVNTHDFRITFLQKKFFLPKRVTFEFMCPGTLVGGSKFIWAWFNLQAGLPPPINGEVANEILYDSANWNVEMFQEPILEFDSPEDCEAFLLFILAWAEDSSCAYYRATSGDAALVTLLRSGVFEHKVTFPVKRVKELFPFILEKCSIPSHRISFEHYIKYYHMNVSTEGNSITGELYGEKVTASFDENGKLNDIA